MEEEKKERTGKKKERDTGSTKHLHTPAAAEGVLLTNTALNAYVQEYMKCPTKETYEVLEGKTKITPNFLPPETDALSVLINTTPSLLSVLSSSLVVISDAEIGVLEEERRKRVLLRAEGFTNLNQPLAEIISGSFITEKDVTLNSATKIEEIRECYSLLRKIEERNIRNKRKVLEKRKAHLAQLFYMSLLESVDSGIESVYNKKYRIRKKKKEEDASYFAELEDLLDKRARIKDICKEVPEDILELPQEEIGLESFFPGGGEENEEETKTLEQFFPLHYREWRRKNK